MKKTNLLFTEDELNNHFSFSPRLNFDINHFFRLLSIFAIVFIFSTDSYAQQKSANLVQFEADLVVVNEKIAKIDDQITTINARIWGIPAENVDPSILLKLNDLQLMKDQYTREKISIEAALNDNQSDTQIDNSLDIPTSTNSILPNENQDQFLEDSNGLK